MSLITLAQYKAWTGTTSTTNDTLITNLIKVASNEIEQYCDRTFTQDTYIDWINHYSQSVYTLQYPISKILMIGAAQTALTITNNDTKNYTISINDNKLTITDDDLTSTEYDLENASYDTLTELHNTIESAYTNLAITVATDVSQKSITLKPLTYQIAAGATEYILGMKNSNAVASIVNNLYIRIDEFATCDHDCYYSNCDMVIAYVAGYATIPDDLQQITSSIVKDMLNVTTGSQNSNIKSEAISNYSYTLQDNVNFKQIVNNYSGVLGAYKRVTF